MVIPQLLARDVYNHCIHRRRLPPSKRLCLPNLRQCVLFQAMRVLLRST